MFNVHGRGVPVVRLHVRRFAVGASTRPLDLCPQKMGFKADVSFSPNRNFQRRVA